MRTINPPLATRLALGAAMLAVLAGCARGGEDGGKDPGAGGGATASRSAPKPAGKPRGDGMVAAVSATGKPGAPVDLKFEIVTKPVLGQPLEVNVVVVPRSADIAQLRVVFQSNEAVEVQSGSEAVEDKPQDGVAISHTVTVVPRKEGVFYLGSVALVEGASGSVARSFAIPIIVGDPVAAERALSEKPSQGTLSKSGAGDRIVSLPASESP